MPRAKKNPPPKPSRRCAVCEKEFTPNSGVQLHCDAHKNRHSKRLVDRRRLGAKERPADYYRPKVCEEPDCGREFIPRTGSAKWCDEHQGIDRWSRDHPEERKARGRTSMRRRRHAETFGDPDIYEKLVARQGERCAVCGASPSQEGWHLPVDHDHDSGEVRGLLCPRHNTGLGFFNDSPEELRAAARYLVRARTERLRD